MRGRGRVFSIFLFIFLSSLPTFFLLRKKNFSRRFFFPFSYSPTPPFCLSRDARSENLPLRFQQKRKSNKDKMPRRHHETSSLPLDRPRLVKHLGLPGQASTSRFSYSFETAGGPVRDAFKVLPLLPTPLTTTTAAGPAAVMMTTAATAATTGAGGGAGGLPTGVAAGVGATLGDTSGVQVRRELSFFSFPFFSTSASTSTTSPPLFHSLDFKTKTFHLRAGNGQGVVPDDGRVRPACDGPRGVALSWLVEKRWRWWCEKRRRGRPGSASGSSFSFPSLLSLSFFFDSCATLRRPYCRNAFF